MGRGGFRSTKPFGQAKPTPTKSHVSSGALTGSGSSLGGAANRSDPVYITHSATGALTGSGSSLSGAAARTRTHNAVAVLLGGGSSLSGAANRAGGGGFLTHNATGTLVGAGASLSGAASRGLSMLVGMNLRTPYYTAGAVPFVNLMWMADLWQTLPSYAPWPTQDQGLITGATGTTENVAIMATAGFMNLPAGTYTYRNSSGGQIGFGDNAAGPNLVAYSTATSGNFTLGADSGLAVFCKGNLSGNLEVFMPGTQAGYDTGQWFNSAYLNFHDTLGTQVIRTMDWLDTNNGIGTNWADRSVLGKPRLTSAAKGYPYEVAIAFSNAMQKPLWLNIPVRATDAYVTALGAMLASDYDHSTIYVEYGNETWNDQNVFRMGNQWVIHLEHTRWTVPVDAATGLFTLTAHGFPNDSRFKTFVSLANRQANTNDLDYYPAAWGFDHYYLKSISANTFELWSAAGGTGTKLTLPAGNTSLVLIRTDEAGKTQDLHGFHAKRSKQIWDILDAAIPGKVKAVMPSQAANPGVTTDRMANATYAARVNYVATAPYFNSAVMGAQVVRASNSFTPKLWTSSYSQVTCYFGVYPQGTVPTDGQLKSGVGGGVVAHGTFTHTYDFTQTYATGSAETVVNGTTYTCWFGVLDGDGYFWRWSQDIAAANVTDTIDVLDDFDNLTMRSKINVIVGGMPTSAAQHLAAAVAAQPTAKLLAYEGGNHQAEARPAVINTWWKSWWESAGAGSLLTQYMNHAASVGFESFAYYTEQRADGTEQWGLADNTYDTSDPRYVAMSAFAGAVPVTTLLDVADIDVELPTDPPSFPHTAHTFANGSLTYTLLCGDEDANFAIVGAQLRMVNDTGVNWSAYTTRVLKIFASNGSTASAFDVNVVLGSITSSFDPSTLFSSGQKGFWYDVSDLSTLFQDTAGTVPVTTAGQTVGKMLDKSGNGAHIVFGNTNKPTYATGSGLKFLSFAGMVSRNGWTAADLDMTAHSALTLCMGLRKTTDTVQSGTEAAAMAFGEVSSSGVRGFEISAPDWSSGSGNKGFGAQLTTGVNNFSTRYVSGVQAPISRVLTTTLDRSQVTVADQVVLRLNGVVQTGTTSGSPVTGAFTANPVILGARDAFGSIPFNGNFYGAICRGGSNSGTDISNMENWVGARTGFAL
jgi:hypothetical protein